MNEGFIEDPEFHHLIRALLHRISAISYFHCGEELNIDYRGLIEKSKKIEKKKSSLKWVEINRYSTRQETRLKFGGFRRNVNYHGDFSDFIPLLLLGEQIHLDKSSTFGFGKYIMEG